LGFLLIILLVIFLGNVSVRDEGFVWVVGILAVMIGFSYGTASSRIITYTDGVECVSFGLRVKVPWSQVERLDINSFGFVNLVFKQPIYKNRLVNSLLKPLAADRTIQLSPYIENLETSGLLKDIANFVPGLNIPEFVSVHKRGTKLNQKAGRIGLYYLGWLIIMVALAYGLRQGVEYFEGLGSQNLDLVTSIAINGLMIGLFIDGMSLLGYNEAISRLDEVSISRKARTYYLCPVVILILGLILGLGIWSALRLSSIRISEDDLGIFSLLAIFLGIGSLPITGRIEKIIFRNQSRRSKTSGIISN
jgi:hypothetical protein